MPTFSSQKFEKIPQSWRKMTIYPILSFFTSRQKVSFTKCHKEEKFVKCHRFSTDIFL